MERGRIQGLPQFLWVLLIISGTGKAADFKFRRYIQRVNPNKGPIKSLEKRERGRIQRLPNFFPGTGKATNFKFCMHVYRLNWNKSPLKISGKVALGVVRDWGTPENFWQHPYIYGASRGYLCDSSAFVSRTPLSFDTLCLGNPCEHSHIPHVSIETKIIDLHFITDSMGLSLFKFFWWARSIKRFFGRVRFGRLRSSKFIDFGTNRKRHSNLGNIQCCCQDLCKKKTRDQDLGSLVSHKTAL